LFAREEELLGVVGAVSLESLDFESMALVSVVLTGLDVDVEVLTFEESTFLALTTFVGEVFEVSLMGLDDKELGATSTVGLASVFLGSTFEASFLTISKVGDAVEVVVLGTVGTIGFASLASALTSFLIVLEVVGVDVFILCLFFEINYKF